MPEIKSTVEVVPIRSIRPHPRNYKKHPDDQLGHLKRSITEYGVYRNIVVSRDGFILAGHGVTEALYDLGNEEVSIVRLDVDGNDPRALKLLAVDNELGRMALSDDRALSELLKEVAEGADLLGTGFDDMALASLVYVTRDENELQSFDAAAHWVGLPEYEQADKAIMLKMQFHSAEDRERFVREAKVHVSKALGGADAMVWSAWWPYEKRTDRTSVLWTDADAEIMLDAEKKEELDAAKAKREVAS